MAIADIEVLSALFWEPQWSPEIGLDLDLLKRRTYVRDGMPTEDDVPLEADPVQREQQEQEAQRPEGFKGNESWYSKLKAAMNATDPEWEWHTGHVPPHSPVGESGGSSCARNEPMGEQRQRRMREGVYQAPCQNVFTKEFQESGNLESWTWARDSWINASWNNEDEAAQESPAYVRLGEMSDRSQWSWSSNAPWHQAKAHHEKNPDLYPRDKRDDKRER